MKERGTKALWKFLAILAGLALVTGFGFPEAALAQAKLKVGIIHIGSMTDGGYNQAHAEGIAIMKKNLPAVEVIEVENVPETADAERVKAGEHWSMDNLGKMDWLVEGIIGQTK